ncbi:hypothetical protein ACWCW7_29675 [Nocardia tengchongensis]
MTAKSSGPAKAVAARTREAIADLTALCDYYEALRKLDIVEYPEPALQTACERVQALFLGQFRIAETLEKELAELQEARKRAKAASAARAAAENAQA